MKKITEEKLNDIVCILCSDFQIEKKAIDLYAFFDEYNILNSNESYKYLEPSYLLKKIEQLKKIYKAYESQGIFDRYITGCTVANLAKKQIKINTIWEIINSSDDEVTKSTKLTKIYRNSASLNSNFIKIFELGIDNSLFDLSREALKNYDVILEKYKSYETGEIAEKIDFTKKNNRFIRNYDFAKSVISYYVESPDSYKGLLFISELNIDKSVFDKCVTIVRRLDKELYQKYIEKKEYDDKTRNEKYAATIIDVANGIKTGVLADGTKFDILEFFKRIPFSPGNNFVSKLLWFGKNYLPSDVSESVADTIRYYIIQQGMNRQSYYRPVRIEYFKRVKTQLRVQDELDEEKVHIVEMTDEDYEIIFEYLRINNIPPINVTYKMVRDKYLNGEITKETVDQMNNNEHRKELNRILRYTTTFKKEELFK